MSSHTLHHGDCLAVLRSMEADSVDAIVTDPPAGIAFMGKEWDKDKGGRDAWVKWMTEVARECLRVIKPGGHALVWAIPRTSHWTGWAWEDAGWEPRDKIIHLFGSGFPKSLSVSKAIDKAAGAEREVVGESRTRLQLEDHDDTYGGWKGKLRTEGGGVPITAPATDAAKQWDGWGTALKPAAEDWWLFRKPLVGTVAANVLAHGTGAINVDGCRIGFASDADKASAKPQGAATAKVGALAGGTQNDGERTEFTAQQSPLGRWPANFALDEEAAAMLDAQSGEGKSQGRRVAAPKIGFGMKAQPEVETGYGDSGGASRFFYTAKASRRERGEGNVHPTVKPLSLMRWLVRLVCPPDGTVLDPFSGSGTTLLAAKAEGFNAIGIEREAEYVEIIKRRLAAMTPEWLREIESETNPEPEAPDESPTPASIDDLLGFGDE